MIWDCLQSLFPVRGKQQELGDLRAEKATAAAAIGRLSAAAIVVSPNVREGDDSATGTGKHAEVIAKLFQFVRLMAFAVSFGRSSGGTVIEAGGREKAMDRSRVPADATLDQDPISREECHQNSSKKMTV